MHIERPPICEYIYVFEKIKIELGLVSNGKKPLVQQGACEIVKGIGNAALNWRI